MSRPTLVLLACTLSTGCALLGPGQTKASKPGDAIKIGVLSSFSGSSAEDGKITQNGVQAAVTRVNAAGGVLGGRQLEVIVADDRSDAAAASKAAEELITKGAVALIGPNASSRAKAAILGAITQKGVVLVSPAATSPSLTDPAQVDSKGWFFRTVPHDNFQGKVLARRASQDGHKKLAVIYVDSPYGQGLSSNLATAFKAEAGHDAVLFSYKETPKPEASYKELIDKAIAAAPDAFVLIGYPGECSVMINDWRLSGKLQDKKWYFGDSLQDTSFAENVTDPKALEGDVGTAPGTDASASAASKATFPSESSYEAPAAYDSAMLIALAIEAAKSTEKAAIRDALRGVSAGGTKFKADQVKDALEAVRAGKDVDYDGYMGPIDFDKNGDVSIGFYQIWTIKDRKIVTTDESIAP